MLKHRVSVRSHSGKGSVFAIEVEHRTAGVKQHPGSNARDDDGGLAEAARRTGTVLVVEDDPELRELLVLILKDDGHHVVAASDGVSALELMARGAVQPDLILADYNLPNGMDGLQAGTKLRESFHRQIPAIILTGDISPDTLRRVADERCVQLHKPVKGADLLRVIQRLLAMLPDATVPAASLPAGAETAGTPVIFVVEDDSHIRQEIRGVLEAGGYKVEDYADCETFLGAYGEAYRPGRESCLLLDAHLPGMSGFELLKRMTEAGHHLPAIMITGNSDVPMVVQAMKAGASDFIEKPFGRGELLASVGRALEESRDSSVVAVRRETAAGHLSGLTLRQRQIMEMVLDGQPSKNIAADLGISQRTVENHRAEIMRKIGTRSLPALARLVLAAARKGSGEPAA